MKRLFFALWPDEMARRQCVEIAHAIQTDSVNLVKPENLHITLLFLGNIDSEIENLLRESMAGIPVPKLTLHFDELSFWKKPRIICLTTPTLSLELITLVEALSRTAREMAIPIDARPYKPHITLIKKAKSLKVLEFPPIVMHSGSFSLVESCSTSNGVEYRIIEQWETNNPQGCA